MLTQAATPEMLSMWRTIHAEYKGKLYPNKKQASDIIEYLKHKYPLIEIKDKKWEQLVADNVLKNGHEIKKLPAGKKPVVIVNSIKNSGSGKILYENQDDVFRGLNIVVGIELETAFFTVEGSSMLWDELFAFRGLDEDDLNNCYLVSEYISCLKRFDLLDGVLQKRFE